MKITEPKYNAYHSLNKSQRFEQSEVLTLKKMEYIPMGSYSMYKLEGKCLTSITKKVGEKFLLHIRNGNNKYYLLDSFQELLFKIK